MAYLKDKIKKWLKKFFLIDDTPHKIAAGAALGVFFGIAPGEGVATTLIVASILRFNRLAATIGVLATNMWTTLATLPIAAFVGAFLFHENYQDLKNKFVNANHLGWKFFVSKVVFFDFTLPLLVGFIVTAGAISLLIYFGLLFLIHHNRRTAKKDHLFKEGHQRK